MRIINNHVATPGDEPEDDPIGRHLLAAPVSGPRAKLVQVLSRMITGQGGKQIEDAGKRAHKDRQDKAGEN